MKTTKLLYINAASKLGPTHKRTEGRAPVWDFEFTTKAATIQGGFIVVHERMVYEVSRTKELSERRRAKCVDHAGHEVEVSRAWYVLVA
jgi:hypothetical protein